ncbi:NADPH-dependent F420 reductase [Peterkaempfera bronchialis]|uniref:NADPH-dependent F420 reductase n=1 Tax=Peterkaempfera bronchialis TaxID=2126346 RepID=UPI003C2ABFCF
MTADVQTPAPEQVIGILGGSGPQGRGLGVRFAAAGLPVVIGSRKADRAEEAAADIARVAGSSRVTGASNEECAQRSDIVLVVVPFEGHADLLTSLGEALAGKVVVDCVNPLGFDKQGPYPLKVAEGSAAEQARELLPDSTVTAAFHHLSAVLLGDLEVASIDSDVLVLGDDRSATDAVQALAETIPGVRGVYGGRLRNAAQIEALTANLIAANRRYKCHAGVRITDLPV